jgi:hypothetical protein
MNYQVICDKEAMLDFIESLPDTEPRERYYLCLFGRKKYCKDIKQIKSDKSQLCRKLSEKKRLFQKIKQMECEVGSYLSGDDTVPQEALALYINPNPRCMTKACFQALKNIAITISTGSFDGYNPQAEAMSCVQRSKSRTIWSDFDIDTKEDGVIEKVESILLDRNCYKILETRGGYHVLVEPDKIPPEIKKSWYKDMAALADITGDCMLPFPGSYQGGFVPRFIT